MPRPHLWITLLTCACTGGTPKDEGDTASSNDDTPSDVDLGSPHFVFTADGVRYEFQEAWQAFNAGEDSISVSAMDQVTGDRDSLGFGASRRTGPQGCDEVSAVYMKIRNTSEYQTWTSWMSGGTPHADAECTFEITTITDIDGEHVVGTFAFTLVGQTHTGEALDPVVITDGSFRLPYHIP